MFSAQTRRFFQTAQGYRRGGKFTHAASVGREDDPHFFQVQWHEDEGGCIQGFSFWCPRCVAAIACGGYLQQRLNGEPLSRASELNSQELLLALGGLPPTRAFYAWMAVQAVHNALL